MRFLKTNWKTYFLTYLMPRIPQYDQILHWVIEIVKYFCGVGVRKRPGRGVELLCM